MLRFSAAANNASPKESSENVSSANINININKNVSNTNAATSMSTAIASGKKISTASMGMAMSMASMGMNMSTTAVTGSITRSNSVASEGLGLIEITHEAGLNSEAGGGGAYLEVRYCLLQ